MEWSIRGPIPKHRNSFRALICTSLLLLNSANSWAVGWVLHPTATKLNNNEWHVKFEVDANTDVEVAILKTSTSEVIRHLAAGVLGSNPPPPLQSNRLSQDIVWNGRDDYDLSISDYSDVQVRVRAGTSVVMDKIVGGDPYGWYSSENFMGDHAAWGMKQSIDVKSDGNVYIFGNTGTLGSPMIRQYDATGNFIRTVFPFPAGLNSSAVTGWGIRVKADGSYAPAFSSFTFAPTITDSYVVNPYSVFTGTLIPNPQNTAELTVMTTERQGEGKLLVQRFFTDSTIALDSKSGKLIKSPALPSDDRIAGNFFTAHTNNGQYLYISSLYDSADFSNASNFYHEGQIFRINLSTGVATKFFDQGVTVPDSGGVYRFRGFSQLHGVAVDIYDHVFVCDRVNSQIVVLSSTGSVLRRVPVPKPPDNVAISAAGVMYVTTRNANATMGDVYLLKFDNWLTDSAPSQSIYIAPIAAVADDLTDVEVAENNGSPRVWVTYPSAPVKIFTDGPTGLVLEKDFNQLNKQRSLSINYLAIDSKTEALYVNDGFSNLFKVDDWTWINPIFKRMIVDANTTLRAASFAIDERNRFLYARDWKTNISSGPVRRWNLDVQGYYTPVDTQAGSNIVTSNLVYGWYPRTGSLDSGFDVGPDGSLAVSGGVGGEPYVPFIKYFNRNESISPWNYILLDPRAFFNAKMDLKGNIYVARYDGPPTTIPEGYESDLFYNTNEANRVISRIYRYSPTRSTGTGTLYPTTPAGPSKIYDVPYGMTAPQRPSSFGVDNYGRIAYPTAISQQVNLIDNAGNEILKFGTYGNADSRGGLPGELVPTTDVPLAYGHTVDISDKYIYVGDLSNNRIVRVAMRYALDESTLPVVDSDGDTVPDAIDNCPLTSNANQTDSDNNGRGDACEGLPIGC